MRKSFTIITIKIGNDEEHFVAPGIVGCCDDIPHNSIVLGDSQYTIDDFMYDHMSRMVYSALFKTYYIGASSDNPMSPISNDEMICVASVMKRLFISHNLRYTFMNHFSDKGENPYYIGFDIYEANDNTNEE